MSRVYRRNRRRRKKKVVTPPMKVSMACVFCCVIIFFGVLLGRIYYLNVVKGNTYKKQVLSQQSYVSSTLNYRRGEIKDKNGTALAVSTRVFNMIIEARTLKAKPANYEPTLQAIVGHFGVDRMVIETAINEKPDSMYVRPEVLRGLSSEQVNAFKEKMNAKGSKIVGVSFEEDYVRKYPLSTVGCDIIGFANKENVGSYGIEESYNEELNGSVGRKYGYFDSNMNLQQTVKAATNGNNVILTIDANVQRIVEKYIDNYQKKVGSKNMAVMLTNPKNGDIYAMASYPTYDLNNPRDLTPMFKQEEIDAMDEETKTKNLMQMWSNFCILEAYEPGSTFKPFTVAAALEEGKASDGETYVCGGKKNVAGVDINCNNHSGHGTITLEQAINKSCNVALMDIGLAMGRNRFSKYNGVFGFGRKTGITLPGESTGLIHTKEQLNPVELATSSFGQTQTVTMVQMMTGFNSLINGGNYYVPRIVKEVQNEEGVVVNSTDSLLVKKTVSENTSKLMRRYLETTVSEGTANPASVKGYTIGGKTGTAEKRPVTEKNYLVSFIGCVPADDPQVSIYVIIDEPHVEDQAHSTYATEFASKLMKKVLPFLGVYAK